MRRFDCPNCGHANPRHWRSCENCGFVLREDKAKKTAVEYVPCATCNGAGVIYLDYLDGYEENPQTQRLSCADCSGTGKRKLTELREEAFKQLVLGILEALG
ncbi:MAG: hypothetical protein R3293_28820 [Candidatus Promineifilaceae bacterium]|nr:hypothetical protein [Candidatus Promineifilaceae bacterium]